MPFIDSFQEKIWKDKYQYKDETYEGFCERIAYTIFPAEKEKAFQLKESIMGFRTLFGGRINSNIGTDEKGLTLFNCFIEATVKNPDSLEGIFDAVAKYGLTLKSEGGVGFCANYLRPANTLIRKVGVTTPGVTKFLEIFDKVSEVITSGSVIKEDSFQGEPTKKSIRKGATMVTLSCCHPDIEDFITAKSVPNKLTKMNMSVLITDAFMYAVDNDLDWDLWFPDISFDKYDNEWDGDFEKWAIKGYPTVVYKTIKANYLWESLLKSSYNRNEPGLLFIDTIRRMDNLHYLDSSVNCCNPCQPSWASVLTKKGIKQFKDIDIGTIIWSENGWVEVLNKQSSGVKDVYKYRTNAGVFYGTKNHRVVSKGKKVEVREAISIDVLLPPIDVDFDLTSKKYLDDLICGDIDNTKIISDEHVSTEEVFDITVSGKSHTYWTGGCNVSNCAEIPSNTGIIEHKGKTYELGDICNLGSLVLPYYYNMDTKVFNKELFIQDIEIMIEALDNIIDISGYPLDMYEQAAKMKRKIGLGVAGVGSLFMMMGIKYGSEESVKVIEDLMDLFMNTAYQKSTMLAKEKGPFELYSDKLHSDGYVKNNGTLTTQTINLIKKYGLRHSAISAIAPNGSLAILAGNMSGGLEPVFSPEYIRWNRVEGKKVDFDYPNTHKGEWFETYYLKEEMVADEVILMATDGKYRVDKNQGLSSRQVIRDYGYNKALEYGLTEHTSAMELDVQEHFNILKAITSKIDQSSSKTINLPADISFEDFKALYGKIHKQGIKGCTTYREGTSVAILETKKEEKDKVIKKQHEEFLEAFKAHENGNIIHEVIKLPEEYPSKGFILRGSGRKWYLHVSYMDLAMRRPYALFVSSNSVSPTNITESTIEELTKIAKKYKLNGKKLEVVKKKFSKQQNAVKIVRMLGFLLRHGTPMVDIVTALSDVKEAGPGHFVWRLKKFLIQYVPVLDTKKLELVCPACGSADVVLQEGCVGCRSCNYSGCS